MTSNFALPFEDKIFKQERNNSIDTKKNSLSFKSIFSFRRDTVHLISGFGYRDFEDNLIFFLVLTHIFLFEKDLFKSLKEDLNTEKLNDFSVKLADFYKRKSLTFFNLKEISDYSLDELITVFNLDNSYHHIRRVLNFLEENNYDSFSLFNKEIGDLRVHRNNIGLRDTNTVVYWQLVNFLKFYGLKDGENIIYDGNSGAIGLARSLSDYVNFGNCYLETTQKINAQIGRQISMLQNSGKENDKIVFRVINPFITINEFEKENVDFYISYPQNPRTLLDEEIAQINKYSLINYDGNIARYSAPSLWIQYALSKLKPSGIAIIGVPQGFLSRSGYDYAIRKYLIKNKLLRVVIELNPKHHMFPERYPFTFLIISKQPKDEDVYFYNMEKLPKYLGAHPDEYNFNFASIPFLPREYKEDLVNNNPDININLDLIEAYVTTKEIEEKDYNFEFDTYQRAIEFSNFIDLSKAKKSYDEAFEKLADQIVELTQLYEK